MAMKPDLDLHRDLRAHARAALADQERREADRAAEAAKELEARRAAKAVILIETRLGLRLGPDDYEVQGAHVYLKGSDLRFSADVADAWELVLVNVCSGCGQELRRWIVDDLVGLGQALDVYRERDESCSAYLCHGCRTGLVLLHERCA